MTPIDTDAVTGVLATHGVKLPNRTGIFGGYPGSCARYEVVRGSDIERLMAASRPIERLDQIGGHYELLGSVSAGVGVPRGDVVNIRMQNGGGYGDPIDREAAVVLRDVLDGKVTRATASAIYGVVVGEDSVDTPATAARREAIRRHRREAMRRPGAHAPGTGRSIPLPEMQWGELLKLHNHGSRTDVHCAHCDANLGELTSDWRDVAGVVAVAGAELGPYVEVHEALAANQYVCPSCASLLWVEVVSGTEAAVPDFALGT